MIRRWPKLAAALAAFALLGVPCKALAAGDALGLRVRSEVERFVRARAASPAQQVEVPEVTGLTLAGVDPSDVELVLSSQAATPYRGSVPVTVALVHAGREQKRGVITARLYSENEVIVAAHALPRGHLVTASDVAREKRALRGATGDAASDESLVIGKRTTRALREGDVLRTAWLETPAVVERGERVPLRLQRGRLRIEGLGEARSDGRPGEMIRVLNLSSRRELTGRVDEQGVVHVRF
jgi:flagella basal body P-ring formation protein FlgA